MEANEDLQHQISKDVIAQGQSAKNCRSLVTSGGGDAAVEYARNSYNAFLKLLMEDYISHGCYELPKPSLAQLDDRLLVEIKKIGEILDRYAGPADTAFCKRRNLMELIHSNSNGPVEDRFLDKTVRQLNIETRRAPRVVDAPGDFTPTIVRDLLDSAHDIKGFSREYVGVSPAKDSENVSVVSHLTETTWPPSNRSVDINHGSSGSQRRDGARAGLHYHPAFGQQPGSDRTASEASQSVKDWVDELPGYRYVPGEGPSPDYGPRSDQSDRVISQTPAAILASDTAELATPQSANPDKRKREVSDGEGPETPSAKRRQLTSGRSASARSI